MSHSETNNITTKVCFKCGCEKLLSEFYKHPQMKDGHLNKCKECTKNDVSKNYRKNKSHYKKYDHQRDQSLKRKAQRLHYQRKCRKRDPVKNEARAKVRYAIRTGKITPQLCEVENCHLMGEAHHDDYSQPLMIRWLCLKHHRQLHGQMLDE